MEMKSFMCALMLAPAALFGASSPLFHQGKTDWKIVPSSEAESFAAEELSRTLKQVSKADFDRADAPRRIVLGTPADSREIAEKFPSLKKDPEMDSFAVRLEGDTLYVAGSNPRSVLFGVFSFLKKEVGCRWFWPGPDGEFIPELGRLDLPEKLDYAETAAFRYRALTDFLARQDMRDWMIRVNLNNNSCHLPVEFRQKTGLVSMLGNHVIGLFKKDFERDPNLFGMLDGERKPWIISGCWSNPDFLKLMVERNIQLVDERKIEILIPYPADTTVRCQCPECIKESNASDHWQKFFRKFREEFRKQRPHVRFAGLAYQEYRNVPTCDIDGVLFTGYCMYNRCYVHKLNDPACELNRKAMEELLKWKEKGPIGVNGYHFDIFAPYKMYLPFWNMYADEVRTLKRIGSEGMKTEFGIGGAGDFTLVEKYRLPGYLFAALLWNPDLDVDAEIADFCRVVYGPAARPMERYHKRMAQCWDAQTDHYTYWGNLPETAAGSFLSSEAVVEADALLKEAAKAAEGNPRAAKNVQIDIESFQSWRDYFNSNQKKRVSLIIPLNVPLDKAETLKYVDVKGNPAATTLKLRRSPDALLLQIRAPIKNRDKFMAGSNDANDASYRWVGENMEIFLDYGTGYHHFAYNFAGGKYDAKGQDTSWNPKWSVVSRWEDGNVWVSDVEIPFDSIGCRPENGKWKIVVTRAGCDGYSGFPCFVVHNTASGAELIFKDETAEKE